MTLINIIDIESSGLHLNAYPIEIGVQLGNARKAWLIKPELKWQYWCDTAESMHGISRKQLLNEGQPAAQVVQELNQFVAGRTDTLYSDTVYWDKDWLDTLYFALGRIKPFQVASIFDFMENEQELQFKAIKERLAWTGQYQNHRALDDLKLIQDAYSLATKSDQSNTS